MVSEGLFRGARSEEEEEEFRGLKLNEEFRGKRGAEEEFRGKRRAEEEEFRGMKDSEEFRGMKSSEEFRGKRNSEFRGKRSFRRDLMNKA